MHIFVELLNSSDIKMIQLRKKRKKKRIMRITQSISNWQQRRIPANHIATPPLISRDWEANSMASGRKNNKQHAAKHPNPNRQRRQNLLSLIRRRRVKAAHHILIKQSNGRKNQNRHESVQEINKSQPILSRDGRRQVHGAVDDPQASESGEPVGNIPLAVTETVSETLKKTGESTQSNEAGGEVAGN